MKQLIENSQETNSTKNKKPNAHLGLAARKPTWWEKTKYGGGTQSFPLSSEIFNPQFLGGRFTWNELAFLATLTFVAWKHKDWRIWASESFLKEGLAERGIGSSGSIKRFKKKWEAALYLKRVKYDPNDGNAYLVSSLLLPTYVAETFRHYDEARMLVTHADAKLTKDIAEAEADMRRREASKRKKEQEWLAEVRAAKDAGRPIPELEYAHR